MVESDYSYQHHDTRLPWQQTIEYAAHTTPHLQSSGNNPWQYDQPGAIADFAPYHNDPAQIAHPSQDQQHQQQFMYSQPRGDPLWQQQPQPLRSHSYATPHDRSRYLDNAQVQHLPIRGGPISPSLQSPNAAFTGYEYGPHHSPAFQPPGNYAMHSAQHYGAQGALQATHGQGWYPSTSAYDPEAEGQSEHTFDEAARYSGRQGG